MVETRRLQAKKRIAKSTNVDEQSSLLSKLLSGHFDFR